MLFKTKNGNITLPNISIEEPFEVSQGKHALFLIFDLRNGYYRVINFENDKLCGAGWCYFLCGGMPANCSFAFDGISMLW